jgi:hypothetical protein
MLSTTKQSLINDIKVGNIPYVLHVLAKNFALVIFKTNFKTVFKSAKNTVFL